MAPFSLIGLRRWGLSVGVGLFFLVGLFSVEAQLSKPFHTKPAWWNSTSGTVEFVEEGTLERTVSQSVHKTIERQKIPLGEWWVLGPFAGGGDPWERVYAPERGVTFRPEVSYRGKGGKVLKWMKLSEAEKNKRVPSLEGGVFYLAQRFKVERAGTYWLTMSHREGMALWVDKRPRYRETSRKHRNYSKAVRQRFSAGSHVLFAKVVQGDKRWRVEVAAYEHRPMHLEMRTMTAALLHPKMQDDVTRSKYMKNLGHLYLGAEDYSNAMFWFAREMPLLSEMERAKFHTWLNRACESTPGLFDAAHSFYVQVVEEEGLSDMSKTSLLQGHLDLLAEQAALEKVDLLIVKHRVALDRLLPHQAEYARLKCAVRLGDSTLVRRLVKALEGEGEEVLRDKTFVDLKKLADRLQHATMQLPVDWGLDGSVRMAARLAKEDESQLHRFIRSTLNEKALLVEDGDDPHFFQGAIGSYRTAFLPYAKTYALNLEAYLTRLKGQLGYSDKELETRRSQLSLEFVSLGGSTGHARYPLVSKLALPEGPVFQPLLEMDTGWVELEREKALFDDSFSKAPPATVATHKGLTFFQNSREVACFKNDVLRWRKVFENSELDVARYSSVIHGPLRMAVDGRHVYAKILRRGRYMAMAFHQGTGEVKWIFDDDGRILCTNPIRWKGSVVVVTRSAGELAQYFLVMLDARTGVVQREVLIMSGSAITPFSRFARQLEFDHYMPDPVIAGDDLYLQTHYGVLASYNLKLNGYSWMRRYPKVPFAIKSDLAESVKDRALCRPVVTAKTVVFPSIDCASVQAVDRRSGRLVAEESGFDWAGFYPMGNRVLLINKDGTAKTLSPETLAPLRSLPGSGYAYLAPLSDGAVLQRQSSVEVWKAGATAPHWGLRLPKNVRCLPGSAVPRFAYQQNTMSPVVGSLGSVAGGKKIQAALRSKGDWFVQSPRILELDGDVYVLSQQVLQKLDQDLEVVWSTPIHPRGELEYVQVMAAGKAVYVVSSDHIRILNVADGRVVGRFPENGAAKTRIRAAVQDGDRLYFAAERSWVGSDIMVLRGVQAELLYTLERKYGIPIGVYSKGRVVASVLKDVFRFVKYDPEGKSISTLSSEGIKDNYGDYFRATAGGRYAWRYDQRIFSFGPEGTQASVMGFEKWSGAYYRVKPEYDRYALSPTLFSFRQQATAWNLVDLLGGRDFSSGLKSFTRPLLLGGKVYGVEVVSGDKSPSLRIKTMHPKDGTILSRQEVALASNDMSWRRVSDERFSVQSGSTLYSLLKAGGHLHQSREYPFLRYDSRTRKAEVLSLPDMGVVRGVVARNNRVLFAKERALIRLDVSEIEGLASAAPYLFSTRDLPAGFSLDGLPYEWPTGRLKSVGPHALFLRYVGDDIVLAGRLRNERFIRLLGSRGLDERVSLHLIPASMATFVEQDGEESGVVVPFPALTEGSEMRYSVDPTGESLFFEIRLPRKGMPHAEAFERRSMQRVLSRDLRGDVAFDFSLLDVDGRRHFAFAKKPYGAYFPRARVE